MIDTIPAICRDDRALVQGHPLALEYLPHPADGHRALHCRRLFFILGRHFAPLHHREHPLPKLDVGPLIEDHLALLLLRIVAANAMGIEERAEVLGVDRLLPIPLRRVGRFERGLLGNDRLGAAAATSANARINFGRSRKYWQGIELPQSIVTVAAQPDSPAWKFAIFTFSHSEPDPAWNLPRFDEKACILADAIQARFAHRQAPALLPTM